MDDQRDGAGWSCGPRRVTGGQPSRPGPVRHVPALQRLALPDVRRYLRQLNVDELSISSHRRGFKKQVVLLVARSRPLATNVTGLLGPDLHSAETVKHLSVKV